MTKLFKRPLSILLTAMMIFGIFTALPITVQAADTLPAIYTLVNFNGYEWYVLGQNSSTITLLVKNSIGKKAYHGSLVSNLPYGDSDIKNYLDGLTTSGGTFGEVADAIMTVSIIDNNKTSSNKLYLLSYNEVVGLSTDMKKCNAFDGEASWWLRDTGGGSNEYGKAAVKLDGSIIWLRETIFVTKGVRPACQLDLSKVKYNSSTKTFIPKTTAVITWDNQGIITTQELDCGTIPSYGSTPTKNATAQYTYTFTGWNDGTTTYAPDATLPQVEENVTYTAQFTGTTNTYTVNWKNEDGTVLETDTVEYGTTPTAPTNPTKTATAQYSYTFSNWDKEITAVTGDVTYTALFDEFVIIHDDDVFVNSTTTTPEVFVTDCRTADLLTEGTDYTVTINNDSTVTVEGAGSYTGRVQKDYIVLDRKAVSSVANRRKAGNNAKATLSGEWYLPKNATNIKAGIARISTDDTNVINYNIYRYGMKKFSTLKTTSGKYSFSLLMNSTHAIQNLYTITCVTYEVDGKTFTSISDVAQG